MSESSFDLRARSKLHVLQRAARSMTARLGGIAAGTAVLTDTGYRPIEALRAGDLVAAMIGRAPLFVPATWVGRRHAILPARAQRNALMPVRIARDAIGTGMPHRDIVLAPDHALYLESTLYRASDLVNNLSIRHERNLRDIEYWCVKLERHDIILAENLAIESALRNSGFSEVSSLELPGAIAAEERGVPQEFPAGIEWSVSWFRKRLLSRGRPVAKLPPQPRQAGRLLSVTARLLHVDTEARLALAGLTDLAARWHVRLELAIQPDLELQMAPRSFHEVLDILLVHAMEAAPGGRVLLGAMRNTGRVQIVVVDSGKGASADVQRAELRSVEETIALLGGRMEIDSRPGQGTTILLRLPEPHTNR